MPKKIISSEIFNNVINSLPIDRANLKVREFAKLKINQFSRQGIIVDIVEGPLEENNLLKVVISATKNGMPLLVDNPYLFKNPPILIPDGSTYQEFDPKLGIVVERPNYKEDIAEVFQEIIVQILEGQNK